LIYIRKTTLPSDPPAPTTAPAAPARKQDPAEQLARRGLVEIEKIEPIDDWHDQLARAVVAFITPIVLLLMATPAECSVRSTASTGSRQKLRPNVALRAEKTEQTRSVRRPRKRRLHAKHVYSA
jgi:hypothetical protein